MSFVLEKLLEIGLGAGFGFRGLGLGDGFFDAEVWPVASVI